jgi:hypothetical protein
MCAMMMKMDAMMMTYGDDNENDCDDDDENG